MEIRSHSSQFNYTPMGVTVICTPHHLIQASYHSCPQVHAEANALLNKNAASVEGAVSETSWGTAYS